MNTYKFYCDKCNYGTQLQHLYKQHEETTLHKTGKRKPKEKKDRKKYKCDKCDYNSVNINNYLTHTLNNHDTKKNRKKEFKFYCEKCNFGVFTESCYNKHIYTKKHLIKSN